MPEVDANELRRLRRMEGRLEKAQEKSKTDTAENRNLKTRLRATETKTEDLSKQVTALIEENRGLSEQLENVSSDIESLGKVGEEARQAIDAARAQAREATEARERLEGENRTLASERNTFLARAETAEAQLSEEGRISILPTEEVTRIVGDLVTDLRGSLPGLNVREGEIKLKVAFGGAGERSGFVIPTVESGPEIRENLNELTLRFE